MKTASTARLKLVIALLATATCSLAQAPGAYNNPPAQQMQPGSMPPGGMPPAELPRPGSAELHPGPSVVGWPGINTSIRGTLLATAWPSP